jgi:hypothetical protein
MSLLKQLFEKKSLATLLAEAQGENRLRRILGPVGLTSLGIGAIIGAGIFVMTGRVAAIDAGPAIMVSFVVAGIGCALAALCYAEFASMAPVAGSAYTYAYATLGEIVAWIIGWDLILEYAMSAATVGAHWTKYFNELTYVLFRWRLPDAICNDPFSYPGAWGNLPAMIVLVLITAVLVIGIRESAASNTVLVLVKVGVVCFVVAAGAAFVSRAFWTDIPPVERRQPEETLILSAGDTKLAENYVTEVEGLRDTARYERIRALKIMALAQFRLEHLPAVRAGYEAEGLLDAQKEKELAQREANLKELVPQTPEDKKGVEYILARAREGAEEEAVSKWGILAKVGLNRWLGQIDSSTPPAATSSPTACRASWSAPPWSSSPSLASTVSRRTPRKPSGPSATCRSASWRRWSSARSCTSRCRPSSPECSPTMTSMSRRRSPPPSGRKPRATTAGCCTPRPA